MFENILSIAFSIIGFLFILSVVVLIHEAGHFFTARRFGIKVEEFGFGFPPRLFGKKRKGTIYSINWIPLGGFVKLYGEDDAGGGKISSKDKNHEAKKDLEHAYFTKPAWQRALVILAGILMNFFLAVIIFYIVLAAQGFKTEVPALSEHKFHFVEQSLNSKVYIGEVSKDSPADKAGIAPFSQILEVNGKKLANMKEFVSLVNSNKGKEIILVWTDDKGNTKKGSLTPRVNPPKDQGAIGVSLGSQDGYELVYTTLGQKIISGIIYPVDLMLYNLSATKELISNSVKEKSTEQIGQSVSGPLGIFVVVGAVVSESQNVKELVLQVLTLMGLISITLAFFNVLPIPALDGGRLFFVLVEMVTGKKISPALEAKINTVSFLILIGLLIYITVFFDIPKVKNFIEYLFNK